MDFWSYFLVFGFIFWLLSALKGESNTLHPFLRLARNSARKRNAKKAVRFYEKVGAGWMKADDWSNFAHLLHETGASDKALEVITRAIQKYPDNDELYYMRAHILRETNREAEALQDLDRAIELNSSPYIYWYTRALAHQDLGNYEASISDFHESIKRESADTVASTWYELGMSYLLLQRYEKAIEAFGYAIRNGARAIPIYYYRRACAYAAIDRLDLAIQDGEQAVEMEIMAESQIRSGASNVYSHTSYSAAAIQTFRGFGQRRCSYTLDLAEFYRRDGQMERAIETINRGRELWPESDELLIERGILYREMERWEDALLDFHHILQQTPHNVRAIVERAHTYRKMQKEEMALADFQKAVELDPDSSILHYWLAGSYVVLEMPEKAIESFSKAIELDPEVAQIYSERGEVFQRMERYAEAENDFSRAIDLSDHAELRMKRSFVRYMNGMYIEALEDLQAALDLDNSLAYQERYYYARAMVLWGMEDLQQAEKDLTKAIELNPHDHVNYEKRAKCRHQMGNPEGALADCNRALEINETYDSVIWLRGLILYEQGDYLGALLDAETYVQLHPEESSAYYNLGILSRKLNDIEEAIDHFTKAIDLEPCDAGSYLQRALVWYEMLEWDRAAEDLSQWALHVDGRLSLEERLSLLEQTEGFDEEVVGDAKAKVKEFYGQGVWYS